MPKCASAKMGKSKSMKFTSISRMITIIAIITMITAITMIAIITFPILTTLTILITLTTLTKIVNPIWFQISWTRNHKEFWYSQSWTNWLAIFIHFISSHSIEIIFRFFNFNANDFIERFSFPSFHLSIFSWFYSAYLRHKFSPKIGILKSIVSGLKLGGFHFPCHPVISNHISRHIVSTNFYIPCRVAIHENLISYRHPDFSSHFPPLSFCTKSRATIIRFS
jgi:hypothetical protein